MRNELCILYTFGVSCLRIRDLFEMQLTASYCISYICVDRGICLNSAFTKDMFDIIVLQITYSISARLTIYLRDQTT